MASYSRGIQWSILFNQWRDKFQAVAALPTTPTNFDTFQVSLENMALRYSRRRLSKHLARLTPTFEHVKSFSGALHSIAQIEDATNLTWGALQIVIECVCKHSATVDNIFEMLADINTTLPLYDQALALYPDAESLRWPIHDLFNDYMTCCLHIVKHVVSRPWKNFVKGLFSSSMKDSIMKTRKNMEKNHAQFLVRIQQKDREAATAREIDNAIRLGMLSPTSMALHHRNSSQRSLTITTIPARSNPLFVGRDDEINELHRYLDPSSRATTGTTPCAVIHGLGGQGKSQLALGYHYQYRKSYDSTFWLNSETENDLKKSFAEIAKKVRKAEGSLTGSPASPEEELSRDVEYARDWLEGTNTKWLLIFDNLEDARLVEAYLPENMRGCGSSIITTQKAHMSALTDEFFKMELQPLTDDNGSELLLKFLDGRPNITEDDKDTAHSVSKWVGGLPLALVTIGGYVQVSGRKISEIFTSLKRSSNVWADRGEGSVRYYSKTLATVFDLALGELSTNARHLIDILAFLNPDNIPEEIFSQPQQLPALRFLNNHDEMIGVWKDLGLRQLVPKHDSVDGTYHSIHRSLQKNVLHGLQNDKDLARRQRIFVEVHSMLDQLLPPASRLQQNEKDIWPLYHKYVPHVISVMENSQWPDPPIALTLPFAKMLSNIGTFLWHTGQFRECELAMKRAETVINEQNESFKATAEYEELLSDIYLVTGILADCIGVSHRRESMSHRQKLVELRDRELGRIPEANQTTDDKIRWGNAKGDMACAYLQYEQYGEAKILMEELLVHYKSWGSESEYPFEYSKYYHHSSFILMAEGYPDKAIESAKKGIALELAHAGSEDPTVLISIYDLACLLYNARKFDESLALNQEVLVKRRAICGESSQYTLESHEAVAILLHTIGDHSQARIHLETCLLNRHRANWTDEGYIRAQFWYSRVLNALGDHPEATKQLEAARSAKNQLVSSYPDLLQTNTTNEIAEFDRLLPIWIIQSSGKLHDGGRNSRP